MGGGRGTRRDTQKRSEKMEEKRMIKVAGLASRKSGARLFSHALHLFFISFNMAQRARRGKAKRVWSGVHVSVCCF